MVNGVGKEIEIEEVVEEKELEEEIVVENNHEEELVEKEKLKRNKKEKVATLPVQNLPYPHAPSKKDNARHYARFMDIFKQLQINIPFSEAMEQMPKYAKFMKDILTKKRRSTDQEVIMVDASCSAIIKQTLPKKGSDPGRFTFPVTIGDIYVVK